MPRDLDPERNPPDVEAAFVAVPPERVAEILDGELFTFPRPARPHTRSASRLTMKLGGAFDLGDSGPGGWVILDEPELHLGPRPDKLAPDLAGWKRERMPDALGDEETPAHYDVAPDWVYLHLRDLLVDAQQAARAEDGEERMKPSFIAGDLRQCLSSYEQLAESAILAKTLPRAEQTRGVVQSLLNRGHAHPKIAALCAVVAGILDQEIETLRERPHAGFQKILIFNTLMHTAGALREALTRTVKNKVEPFVEEQVKGAGWESLDQARDMVRKALRDERDVARERLRGEFEARFLHVTHDLLADTGLEMKAESRELVDVMFDRAENHCTQPLFLLRMALWLKGCGEQADAFGVQTFLMKRVGDPLRRSLAAIVDDYLDDTPKQGDAFSQENQERARREIARLARVLAAPEYVARFDGRQSDDDREMRRENFNRPYAPLVMLVSKVGEEGIDLQQHTRYILHYDVEWNPAKMEQREGRVDREGRKTRGAIQVQFFLLKDTYEERVFHTVMQRDAWFQVMIGSKRQELAKGVDDDPEAPTGVDLGDEERGRLTSEERKKVMIDLRP